MALLSNDLSLFDLQVNSNQIYIIINILCVIYRLVHMFELAAALNFQLLSVVIPKEEFV